MKERPRSDGASNVSDGAITSGTVSFSQAERPAAKLIKRMYFNCFI